jgi:hypothetical protein
VTPLVHPLAEVRRAHLRAELDAYYARLHGLTRDELRYTPDRDTPKGASRGVGFRLRHVKTTDQGGLFVYVGMFLFLLYFSSTRNL